MFELIYIYTKIVKQILCKDIVKKHLWYDIIKKIFLLERELIDK